LSGQQSLEAAPVPSPPCRDLPRWNDVTPVTTAFLHVRGTSGHRADVRRIVFPRVRSYQMRHAGAATIGLPRLHEKAFRNSGMFSTTPFVRKRGGACGSVRAIMLVICGRCN